MKSRIQGKLDANHKSICAIWCAGGLDVAETSAQGGFCDAVVTNGNETAIVEIKRREKSISILQLELLSRWKGLSAIICDESAALEMISDLKRKCLTAGQKAILVQFCAKERLSGAGNRKEYAVNRILKMIE